MKSEGFLKIAAIVTAATVGDGIFALPYIFYQSGWLLSLFYLAVLAVLVSAAHIVYLETLEKIGEKQRLLGLTRTYLGAPGFWVGFFAIVLGLLLTLVAYLILGSQFIRLAIPGISSLEGLIVFWGLMAIPAFMSDKHVVELELLGICCTAALVIFIFLSAWPSVVFAGIPAINLQNFFLPFGVVLFSLAGWTSVEPAYESRKKTRGVRANPWLALAAGTLFAAALYAMFAAGILGSASSIATDTVSGLIGWPVWKKEILALCGMIALGTVYLPISREIKNSLEKDLHWSRSSSRWLLLFLPVGLVLLGFNNFLIVVGLVGGLFLSTQYLLIISVGRRALTLSAARKFFLDVIAIIFIAAAVYEAWIFVVH